MWKSAGVQQLADRQPWLIDFVAEDRKEWVRRNLIVPTVWLRPGPISVPELPQAAVGLLILEGLVARRLDVRSHCGAELLGESDLLRPWSYQGHVATIPAVDSFRALTDVELALLDDRFLEVTARVPQLVIALVESCVERVRMDGFFLAIRAVVRIEERLLLTLWHLAERYGRVTLNGVVLRLPRVSHDLLAEMIGARRPSVSGAVNALERRGLVEREGRGVWILKGEPPAALDHLDHDQASADSFDSSSEPS